MFDDYGKDSFAKIAGFLIDESPETLGSKLMLPEWLENHRRALETTLPPLESKA
jgi:hypothetical protein